MFGVTTYFCFIFKEKNKRKIKTLNATLEEKTGI